MKKNSKRQKLNAQKKSAKAAAMKRPGFKSKYAIKKREQANGNFRRSSPFVAVKDIPLPEPVAA